MSRQILIIALSKEISFRILEIKKDMFWDLFSTPNYAKISRLKHFRLFFLNSKSTCTLIQNFGGYAQTQIAQD